jgi:hypothetical protein
MGSSTWWDGRRGIARSDYRQIQEKTSLERGCDGDVLHAAATSEARS